MRQPTPADQFSACETLGYMKNQLLRDSDVMSMRWGLELRVPFVDRALIDRVDSFQQNIGCVTANSVAGCDPGNSGLDSQSAQTRVPFSV